MPKLTKHTTVKPFPYGIYGFSLTEMLVTVSVIGVLGAVGYAGVSGWKAGAEERRMMKDVATLNAALEVYKLSGGESHVESISTWSDALVRLRSSAAQNLASVTDESYHGSTDENVSVKKAIIGLKDAMVDPRLAGDEMDSDEQGSSDLRIAWDDDNDRFYVTDEAGIPGAKRMYLSDTAQPTTTEVRRSSLSYSTDESTNWVWDYTDGDGGNARDVTRVTGNARDVPNTGDPSNNPGRVPLSPTVYVPDPSIPLTLVEFDDGTFTIELSDPDEAGFGDIMFESTTDGVASGFELYSEDLELQPGTDYRSLVVSTEPDFFVNSSISEANYTVEPETPALEVILAKNSYNYAELGGEMLEGSPSVELALEPATVSLSDASKAAIPDRFESSAYFQMVYSFGEGVDPLLDASAQTSAVTFDGDFGSQPVPFIFSDYPEGTGDLIVNVATKTADPRADNEKFIKDSDVVSETAGRDVMTIPQVVFQPEQSKLEENDTVTLSFNPGEGGVPADSVILYRLDGVDPGSNPDTAAGSGTFEYTGPFIPFENDVATAEIIARAYPRNEALGWFNPSEASFGSYFIDLPREESVWAIGATSGELYQIFNYENPTRAFVVEWGEITISDTNGNRPVTGTTGDDSPAIDSLAVTENGIGYFIRNAATDIDSESMSLPLFSLDLSGEDGASPVATFLGDLAPELSALGYGQSSVSGLAIAPNGGLYAAVDRPGDVADAVVRIFSLEDLDGDGDSALDDVALVGETTGDIGTAKDVRDIAFQNDGTMLLADASGVTYAATLEDAAPGSIVDVDFLPGNDFSGLAVRPSNDDIVCSNVAGLRANSLFGALAETPNADYFDYSTRIGESLPAIAFFSHAVDLTPPNTVPTVYAVDGSTSIYQLDVEMADDASPGTHIVVGADAPFGLGAIAHDADSNTVYATEVGGAGSTARLVKFNPDGGSFTELGSLQDPELSIPLAGEITNLAFWCNSLWYIAAGTDDLMRIRIIDGEIDDLFKVSDISDDIYSFGDVGDIAIDSDGKLVFVDSNGSAFSYLIHTVSNFAELADEGLGNVQALAIDGNGTFVAVGADYTSSHNIKTIVPDAGISSTFASTRPTRRFTDFALGQPLSPSVDPEGQSLASTAPMTFYNTIVLGDYSTNSEVEGKTFVGGNLTGGSSANFGIRLQDIPTTEPSLVVVGDILQGSAIQVNGGSVLVGGSTNGRQINVNSGGTVQEGSDLASESISIRVQIEAASLALSELDANGTIQIPTGGGGPLRFNASSSGGTLAIFNISGAESFANSSVQQIELDLNGSEAAVINVSGTNINWSSGNMVGYLTSLEARKRVVWNFFEAESLSFSRNLNGSVLAPLATLSHSTNIDGSVAVRNLNSTGEVHQPLLNVEVIGGRGVAAMAAMAKPKGVAMETAVFLSISTKAPSLRHRLLLQDSTWPVASSSGQLRKTVNLPTVISHAFLVTVRSTKSSIPALESTKVASLKT